MKALGAHRSALILVGAQAIYLHTGQADLAVAVYTTDADLVVEPAVLRDAPKISDLMHEAGFERGTQVGSWLCRRHAGPKEVIVPVDLLVPEAVGGSGRRGAQLGGHGKDVARKARGLEATLTDNRLATVAALEEVDARRFDLRVAGPSALLVAKLHRLAERAAEPRGERLKDKDALDVLRLLRAVPLDVFTGGLDRLRADAMSAAVTREAITFLERLFNTASSPGSRMAVRATAGLEDPVTIRRGTVHATAISQLQKSSRTPSEALPEGIPFLLCRNAGLGRILAKRSRSPELATRTDAILGRVHGRVECRRCASSHRGH